jgi:phosphopantothenoylcysteine decarboxylase / phosphopantothenate---cysteine ligase
MLKEKHIILGVTGGIAAYKSAWLIREFVKAGAIVQVVMTRAATQFITPLTLSTLSQRETIIDMFPPSPDQNTNQWTKHIGLSQWADIMLIAPATANTLAKIAHGMADDFLTTLVLALRCPLVIAPSMDVDMYRNEITQGNIDILKETGYFLIDPDFGELASGLTGPGRLPEIDRLVGFVDDLLEKVHQDLTGRRILVTAGPTQEPIDPVRFLSNRSSGKMGFALANAAALRGAEVTLVSGPVHLRTPRNIRRIDVETANDMNKVVQREFPRSDIVIMSAAVADFSPAHPVEHKLKRGSQENRPLTVELKGNPDILKSLGKQKTHQVMVGFALETEDGIKNAKRKLTEKHLDAIILNNPNVKGAGFGVDTNVVTVITADGKIEKLPVMSKFDVATEVLNRVVTFL